MNPKKSFLDFLNKFIPLSQDEYNELILPCIILRNFEKKEIVTHTGEVEEYINFIDQGLVRNGTIALGAMKCDFRWVKNT